MLFCVILQFCFVLDVIETRTKAMFQATVVPPMSSLSRAPSTGEKQPIQPGPARMISKENMCHTLTSLETKQAPPTVMDHVVKEDLARVSASDVTGQTNSDIGIKGITSFTLGSSITAQTPSDIRPVNSEMMNKKELFEILLQTHLDLEKEHTQGRAVTDVSAKAHSETDIVRSAQRVPPDTILGRREIVRRLAEALQRHLSSSVLPKVSPSTSAMDGIVEESWRKPTKMILTATTPHSGFPVNEKCSASLTEETEKAMEALSLKLSEAIVDSLAPRVSAGRIPNREETLGTPAEIPDGQTAPRGSPQKSSEMISGEFVQRCRPCTFGRNGISSVLMLSTVSRSAMALSSVCVFCCFIHSYICIPTLTYVVLMAVWGCSNKKQTPVG